jgi:hypothetical protein
VEDSLEEGKKLKQLAACHRCNTMTHSDKGSLQRSEKIFARLSKPSVKNVKRLVTLQTCVLRAKVSLRMERKQKCLC